MPRRILRRCIACRKIGEKHEFLRVVRKKSGEVVFDSEFKEFGRSAYLCKKKECIEKGFKRKRLEKALRINSISKEVKERLKEEILTYIKEVNNEKVKSI